MGVRRDQQAVCLCLLGRWGGVVSAGAAAELAARAVAAAIVRGLASVA